jgi:ribA/ribD-fused uncharacterized protein
MTFTKMHPEIKTSETDTHVFFLNGPFSQWHPSNFRASIPVANDSNMVFDFHCCEQYMMARKAALFGDMEVLAEIMQVQQNPEKWQEAPKLCKELGKKVRGFDQKVWDENNDDIVFDGNFAKFDQNPDLQTFMMSFGDKIIVEGAWYDAIWGVKLAWDDPQIIDPANWKGQNKLGNVLMDVQATLRGEPL